MNSEKLHRFKAKPAITNYIFQDVWLISEMSFKIKLLKITAQMGSRTNTYVNFDQTFPETIKATKFFETF